ncbi:MAG: hypothetical protein STSR0009_22380 [Methanoregula sp.]
MWHVKGGTSMVVWVGVPYTARFVYEDNGANLPSAYRKITNPLVPGTRPGTNR